MLTGRITCYLRRKPKSRLLLLILFILLYCLFFITFYNAPSISPWASSQHNNETNRRIFFHETSGAFKLTLRQCCAVESAAKHNPTWPIQVFLSKPDRNIDAAQLSGKHLDWLSVLRCYRNVQVMTIDLHDYFKGTPLEEWYLKGIWQTSPYRVVHLSDYIRMLSLYKDGGLYMDLDVISVRSLGNDLANFFALEDKNCSIVPNSVLHLERGHEFIELIMAHLADEYDPDEWVFHGSAIMTAVMRSNCGFEEHQTPPTNTCHNQVKLLPYELFFPVTPENYSMLLTRATREAFHLINQSYGVHVWNSKLRHELIDMHSNQFLVELMKQHCPLTFSVAVHCSQPT